MNKTPRMSSAITFKPECHVLWGAEHGTMAPLAKLIIMQTQPTTKPAAQPAAQLAAQPTAQPAGQNTPCNSQITISPASRESVSESPLPVAPEKPNTRLIQRSISAQTPGVFCYLLIKVDDGTHVLILGERGKSVRHICAIDHSLGPGQNNGVDSRRKRP